MRIVTSPSSAVFLTIATMVVLGVEPPFFGFGEGVGDVVVLKVVLANEDFVIESVKIDFITRVLRFWRVILFRIKPL